MARAKHQKKTRTKLTRYVVVSSVIIVMLFVLPAILAIAAATHQADVIGKYQLLEKIDNQACRYLDNQSAINGSFDLNVNASKGTPKLIYKCLTGETTTAREIHGKPVIAYELGATVAYFSSNAEAEKFAEAELNPLRFWGVDEEGQQNGIPQTSRFTFIVTDEEKPYYDAYTVKANAVLRVSLSCSDQDISKCHAEANSILDRELKGINVL